VTSRFAGIGRSQAMLVIFLLAAAMFGSAWSVTGSVGPRMTPPAEQTDAKLYRSIIAGVESGHSYYPVAARELRSGHYPLVPFVAFRLPTLTWISAAIGMTGLHWLQLLLGSAVMLAWGWRWRAGLAPAELATALFLLGCGLIGLVQPATAVFHESWAALLLALAIALDRSGTAALAIFAGTAALLVRELSAPMILVFAALALVEGPRRRALGWTASLAIFVIVLMLHARAVSGVVLPTDLHSPGWGGLLGPGFAFRSLALATAAIALPAIPAALLFTTSLFGLASIRADWGVRATLMVAGYVALLAIIARADTFYWAMMAAPLSLVGLAFALRAMRDLAAALRAVPVTTT
jgi:hypothetical protein